MSRKSSARFLFLMFFLLIQRFHWFSKIPYLFLTAFVFLAARPLWSSAPFFYSDDGILHLLRVYALDRMLHQGVIYPRWLMDLAFGYGYPIFDFYPPLADFLGESLHLIGFDFTAAVKGTFFIAILMASFGSYLLGRDLFNGEASTMAGILTSVAYVFFPYFLSDIYTRGANAEALGASILPWVFWSLRRTLRTPDWANQFFLALFLAAMLVAHSLTMLVAAPMLLSYFFFEWRSAANERMRSLSRVTSAGLVSIGLGAFYWLPFISNLPTVRMGQGIYAIEDVFQSNFISLDRLIQFDFFYSYDPAPFSIGAVAFFLALLGTILVVMRRSRERATVLYFGVIAAISAFLMLEQAKDLWLRLPFTMVIQYPWRLSILAGLGVAVAIGSLPKSAMVFFPTHARVASAIVAALCTAALVSSAIINLNPQPLYLPNDSPTLGQLSRLEAYSGFLGTTTWGEYLPAAVKPVNLLNFRSNAAASSQANLGLLEYTPYHRVLSVSASEPFTLTLRTLYNSAWRVQADGAIIPAFPNTPMSLLAAAVPAGTSQIQFDLLDGFSPIVGFAFSASSLAILFAVIAMHRRESQTKWLVATMTCCFSVFVIPAFFAVRAPPQQLQPMWVEVSPSVELIGMQIENAHLEGDTWRFEQATSLLHFTLFWQVMRSLQDRPVAWRLVDASGNIRANPARLPRYGTGIAAGWIPNEVVQDEYDLPFKSLAPGRYSVQVSWDGNEFTTVSAVFLERLVTLPEPTIQKRVNARVGGLIRLIGYDAPSVARPGEKLFVTLFWQADQNVSTDYTVFVQLLDAEGNAVARPQVDTPPGGGLAFTSLWNPGEIVTDRVEIDLPSTLQSGIYHLVAGLYHYPDLDRLTVLDEAGQSSGDYVTLGQVQVAR